MAFHWRRFHCYAIQPNRNIIEWNIRTIRISSILAIQFSYLNTKLYRSRIEEANSMTTTTKIISEGENEHTHTHTLSICYNIGCCLPTYLIIPIAFDGYSLVLYFIGYHYHHLDMIERLNIHIGSPFFRLLEFRLYILHQYSMRCNFEIDRQPLWL